MPSKRTRQKVETQCLYCGPDHGGQISPYLGKSQLLLAFGLNHVITTRFCNVEKTVYLICVDAFSEVNGNFDKARLVRPLQILKEMEVPCLLTVQIAECVGANLKSRVCCQPNFGWANDRACWTRWWPTWERVSPHRREGYFWPPNSIISLS